MPNNQSSTPSAPPNRLLARLPNGEYRRILSHLQPVELKFKQTLYHAKSPIEYVYFPTRGVASTVAYVGNGNAIEVSTVGDEGMVGLPALLSDATSANEVFMQVAGEGLRMPATTLRKEAGPGSPLHVLLVQYLSAYLTQLSQAVACNGLHPVRARCCKWLLMTHDRVHTDELPLTHEFLAIMLGVRRASVTEVLQPLHNEGLVRSSRGKIAVLNREGLEAASCECYRLVTDEYNRLLG
jgi:CRP-like cAMP-binding protein